MSLGVSRLLACREVWGRVEKDAGKLGGDRVAVGYLQAKPLSIGIQDEACTRRQPGQHNLAVAACVHAVAAGDSIYHTHNRTKVDG